jgi:oxygen-independent coproporphyrinogen-3 oxidase
LKASGYQQYEISAYAQQGHQCKHNLNYWMFGDYLGIGAGAHSKISKFEPEIEIERFSKPRHPKQYMNSCGFYVDRRGLEKEDLILEFMMNTLRLSDGFPIEEFEMKTGLKFSELDQALETASEKGLIQQSHGQNGQWRIKPTEKGLRFLNDLLTIFS